MNLMVAQFTLNNTPTATIKFLLKSLNVSLHVKHVNTTASNRFLPIRTTVQQKTSRRQKVKAADCGVVILNTLTPVTSNSQQYVC